MLNDPYNTGTGKEEDMALTNKSTFQVGILQNIKL